MKKLQKKWSSSSSSLSHSADEPKRRTRVELLESDYTSSETEMETKLNLSLTRALSKESNESNDENSAESSGEVRNIQMKRSKACLDNSETEQSLTRAKLVPSETLISLSSNCSSMSVPPKPMIEIEIGSNVWYQATIIKQTASEVKLSAHQPDAKSRQKLWRRWVFKASNRIWRGSYAKSAWRYLGHGGWTPKNMVKQGQSNRRSAGTREACMVKVKNEEVAKQDARFDPPKGGQKKNDKTSLILTPNDDRHLDGRNSQGANEINDPLARWFALHYKQLLFKKACITNDSEATCLSNLSLEASNPEAGCLSEGFRVHKRRLTYGNHESSFVLLRQCDDTSEPIALVQDTGTFDSKKD
uniref:Uncharacterized protein n=1 Tax=Polytomella parva TaxID=51329 RepID=A0A7S0YIB1_9CHLO|mmetsp:Transcript_31053/g.56448  ORF Transcript_31053/g.56448 Transcript_31053/m.56448 type:complete len:358 (+) Transcript_31053:237-1310(+)|eukprot:CAMPEP_0175080680 /NCGR_PEP_ID=MMETSP0052_2-20121109/25662_1 /TAXON_ID=51329 ORGANISM="Polytomella parva, Strain SAG 63-3" /NCGR_SAMPLE_ID=MMETSP0052_2 /ASSEMBLY_ACC=CAM_ASM_000194 /LENGTH=357 /DNA_ID=CAMNT_0016351447 /DNA_START=249 /DNA_END=1322 /DNA_ORIENTATION=-